MADGESNDRSGEDAVAERPFPPGYQWDPGKADGNVGKHGVDFWEAATVFDDPAAEVEFAFWTEYDEARNRVVGQSAIGQTVGGRVLLVAFTDRGPIIWIISARPAEPQERKKYEEQARQRGFIV
ncbi:hypothetical protein BH24CHL10_BH24CHL10_02000 [soil metagenome]